MATHSSTLAWKIPWTEEPGRLQSMGSKRVGHNWATNSHTHHSKWDFPGGAGGKEPACQGRRCKRPGFDPWVRKIPWKRAWQLTPVFLLGESHGHGSLVGHSPRGGKESDTTKVTQHAWLIIDLPGDSQCETLLFFLLHVWTYMESLFVRNTENWMLIQLCNIWYSLSHTKNWEMHSLAQINCLFSFICQHHSRGKKF